MTPVPSAMARTSSWTGLPSMIPQAAAGVADAGGVVQGEHGLQRGEPRRDELRPPENPAKKCGSTKPVVMRTSASTHSRLSQTGTSLPNRPIHRSELSSRESWLTIRTASTTASPNMARSSGLGVAAVGAGGDQDHDVVQVDHPVELGQDGRDHQVPGLRPGEVARGDRHRLPAPHAVPQRAGRRRGLAERAAQFGRLVRRRAAGPPG